MRKFITIAILLLAPVITYPQIQIEGNAGVGATVVNLDRLVLLDEISGTYVNDWSVFSGGAGLQVWYPVKSIALGGELKFQHLYWYSVVVPYGYTNIYRDYTIDVFKLSVLARLGADKPFNADIGVTANFNSDGAMFGVLTSLNYYINITDRISIPLKLRGELMSGIVLLVPVNFQVGFRYSL